MQSNNQQKLQPLRLISWDYNVEPQLMYDVLTGKAEKAGPFSRDKILLRMMERLSWYDLLDILGMEGIKSLLTRELIQKLRFEYVREKYEFIRKVLHGEPVSFSGWDPRYREAIRHTLLSNRWYRTQQALL